MAITGSVLRRMHKDARTELDKAISELSIGAFFYACRSCEYTSGDGDRRTKLLRLRNIEFRRGNRIVPHSDPHLERCETVSITFEYQKRDERDETITHYASGDALLCPVRSWASVVQRVRAYPGATKETHVNAFLDRGEIEYIKGKAVRERAHPMGCRCDRQGSIRLWARGRRHSFHQIGSGDGDVPCGHPTIRHNATRPMVIRRLPQIHPKAGETILSRPQRQDGEA